MKKQEDSIDKELAMQGIYPDPYDSHWARCEHMCGEGVTSTKRYIDTVDNIRYIGSVWMTLRGGKIEYFKKVTKEIVIIHRKGLGWPTEKSIERSEPFSEYKQELHHE